MGRAQRCPSRDPISDAEGAYAERIDIGGIPVGVVGINTAWPRARNL
jgi:hypothetical protein